MSVPDLDPEQRRAARRKATEARRIRAELKQMLKTGEVGIAQVLDRVDSSDALARMRVSALIRAMPGYGKVRARRLMEELDISTARRLRGLGSRQRAALLRHFDDA